MAIHNQNFIYFSPLDPVEDVHRNGLIRDENALPPKIDLASVPYLWGVFSARVAPQTSLFAMFYGDLNSSWRQDKNTYRDIALRIASGDNPITIADVKDRALTSEVNRLCISALLLHGHAGNYSGMDLGTFVGASVREDSAMFAEVEHQAPLVFIDGKKFGAPFLTDDKRRYHAPRQSFQKIYLGGEYGHVGLKFVNLEIARKNHTLNQGAQNLREQVGYRDVEPTKQYYSENGIWSQIPNSVKVPAIGIGVSLLMIAAFASGIGEKVVDSLTLPSNRVNTSENIMADQPQTSDSNQNPENNPVQNTPAEEIAPEFLGQCTVIESMGLMPLTIENGQITARHSNITGPLNGAKLTYDKRNNVTIGAYTYIRIPKSQLPNGGPNAEKADYHVLYSSNDIPSCAEQR